MNQLFGLQHRGDRNRVRFSVIKTKKMWKRCFYISVFIRKNLFPVIYRLSACS